MRKAVLFEIAQWMLEVQSLAQYLFDVLHSNCQALYAFLNLSYAETIAEQHAGAVRRQGAEM